MAFLDADDLWMPEKLALQFDQAERSGVGAVFCDLRIIDVNGNEIPQGPRRPVSLNMEDLLLHSETIPQGTSSTLLVRRSLLDAVGGYDESLATMADWDLLIRLRQAGVFGYVDRPLVAYRRYPGTMSRNVSMLERESQMILDKVFRQPELAAKWRGLEGKSRAWNDMVLSGSHFADGNRGAAMRFGLRAVRRDPLLLSRFLMMPIRRLQRGFRVAR